MKEVTFKNVKCKTGGMIPRKGDARYERYPNIEMTVEGIQEERFKDNLRGFTRRKVVFKVLKNRNFDEGNMAAQDAQTSSGPKDQGYNRSNQRMAGKYNSDARQIGAYERIDMQSDVTYMEQPGRVIDQKGTSA
ncbi:hypothetical protein AgCh_008798 [Apium graveolens]